MIIISGVDPQSLTASIAAVPPHIFLPKPVEKAALLAAVANALAKSSA